MRSLVHAEMLKLRTVRMPVWLLLTALGLGILLVVVTVPTGNASGGTLSLHDHDLLARVLGVGAGGWVIVLLLGILAFTQELRFGTATSETCSLDAGRVRHQGDQHAILGLRWHA